MKPLDPRLLRHARAARGYVFATAGLGLATAGLVVAQAILIASIAAPAITQTRPLTEAWHLIGALAVVVALRALATGVQERFAHRAATRVVIDLRTQVLRATVAAGPRWAADGHGPATVTLLTRGLDDLGPYFVRYLPQLLLASTVTPATLAVIGILEWVSALIIIITIPLVPIFMILVGQLTQGVANRRLATMQRLSAQVLDLVAGLPTLRAFGRENGPGARVRALGHAHRRSTMGTLRVAFLSGMVLELLTTLSVAVVAVGIGLRLVDGQLDLFTGLAVLILAPEVYLPLRQVGLHFHASTDGIAAAEAVFALLETETSDDASRPRGAGIDLATLPGPFTIELADVGVRAPGRAVWAPASLTGTISPGEITALVGANGAGKSTAILAILGLIRPERGSVSLLDGAGARHDLADIDLASWHALIAWVPQRSVLVPGTILGSVLDTVSPLDAEPRDIPPAVLQAAAMTGLDDVVAGLPAGWATPIGHGGQGISRGQGQRIALTRALVSEAPVVVLDEPTAHLDALSGEQIRATLRTLRAQGRTVLIAAHHARLVELADHVLDVSSAHANEEAAR